VFCGAVVWYFDLVACAVSFAGHCYCMVSFYWLWNEPVENWVLDDYVGVELLALVAEFWMWTNLI
jgi:hypothetical protein